MNIAYFATGQFGARILKGLIETEYKPDLLVTNPDRPAGRGKKLKPPPCKKIVLEENIEDIEILQPENLDDAFTNKLKQKDIDLALSCDFGRIIPKQVLNIPDHSFLGLHPSLLPKLRGATPIKTAILEGKHASGVTLYLMDEKIDHGPILAQSKINIDDLYYPEARDKLAQEGVELLAFAIPQWLAGNIEPEKQDHTQATMTHLFKKEDGRIDWSNDEVEIYNKIRALNPWPGTFTFFKHKRKKIRLKILKAELTNPQPKGKEETLKPGAIVKTREQLSVKTGFGLIHLTRVQPAGKNEMTGKDFLNGYQGVDSLTD